MREQGKFKVITNLIKVIVCSEAIQRVFYETDFFSAFQEAILILKTYKSVKLNDIKFKINDFGDSKINKIVDNALYNYLSGISKRTIEDKILEKVNVLFN